MQSCDLKPLATILNQYPHAETSLIQVLQDVQREYRFLPCEVLTEVARVLEVPLAKVFSVATFYKAFSLDPQGRVVIKVCMGTACHIRGAPLLAEEVTRVLHIGPGQTTHDMNFTLQTVNCVGACAMAPLVIVGDQYHGNAKPSQVPAMLGKGE